MVFNHTYRIGLEDCGKENEATNKAILTILEDIAGLHSATVIIPNEKLKNNIGKE